MAHWEIIRTESNPADGAIYYSDRWKSYCEQGYEVDGQDDTTIACTRDGSWSDSLPDCHSKMVMLTDAKKIIR